MDFLQAIFLGALEGFTEFLPISSTAHLILASRVLDLPASEYLKSFTIAIQFGAILAVVFLYGRRFLEDWEGNKKVLVALLPTALVGFGLYKVIKGVFFESLALVLAALFLGGLFLIIFERFYKNRRGEVKPFGEISYRQAFLIGLFQAFSIIPGVSRAAATIVGGLILGVERQTIVEFSFLLAVPTVAAATGYDLLQNASSFSLDQFHLLGLGFVVSFLFAVLGIRFLLNYVKTQTFTGFGLYRIILGAIFFFTIFG